MSYEKQTKMILEQLGVNRSYLGYNYVVYGVSLVIRDETCLNYITKSLYVDIASKYHTTWRCVERNIRTVVELVWCTKNRKLLHLLNRKKLSQRPTNREFLLMLADYIIRAEEIYMKSYNEELVPICVTQYICPENGMECGWLKLLYGRVLEMECQYNKL